MIDGWEDGSILGRGMGRQFRHFSIYATHLSSSNYAASLHNKQTDAVIDYLPGFVTLEIAQIAAEDLLRLELEAELGRLG